jgi:lipid-A-disaccharide synthase-like uncharacterized protein
MSLLAACGWLGSACFFSRGLVQWLASERARKVECPATYWRLSLAGSVLLGVYSFARREPVLLAGLLLNGCFYARNLHLERGGTRLSPRLASVVLVLALPLLAAPAAGVEASGSRTPAWFLVAIAGQVLWSSRFALQWWASERAGRSRLPVAFWYVSLCGNCLLLAYALHLRDPVFVASFALGPLAQVRNLWLARGHPASAAPRRA